MAEGKEGERQGLNRRDFLKITAVGTAGGALGTLVHSEAMAQKVPKKWDRQVDVVVVGTGFAGLAAAIEAHDAGSSVIILEKMPVIGGNSVIAGGVYNTADLERQKAQGIKDSPEWHFEQTIAAGDFRADPARVRFITDRGLEGWQWLEKMGVKLYAGKVFQVYGALWPRSHRPQYKERENGAAIIAALHDHVKSRKIPLLLEHKIVRIVREKPLEGRVVGVEAEGMGKRLTLKARKAVVLASGGFCADVEMRMRHDPRFDARFGTTNHAGATGETLMMAADIGADIVGLDFIQSIGPTGPDVRFVKSPAGFAPLFDNPMYVIGRLTVNHAIYTDLRGKRIVATDARRDYITEASMRTPERVCVGIFDAVSREVAEKPPAMPLKTKPEDMMKKYPNQIFKADSLQELAQKVGMPDPKGLEETVARFNSFVDAKSDPDFGQLPINLIWKCGKPPFWAATGSPALHHMCGGVRTKPDLPEVIDRWGKVIPGFYAAGEITGGMHGTNRLGGNGTTDAVVFGRIAGIEAAKQKSRA